MSTGRNGSIGQGYAQDDPDRKNPRKRYDTRFKQQKSPHLEIKISPRGISPLTILIGTFFIPIGIGLIYSSFQALEHVIDYTNCTGVSYSRTCALNFTLPNDFGGKVMIYYSLTNFYQNHRRFTKSKDDRQLHGDPTRPSQNCRPYDIEKSSGKIYWPCGTLANAMFQDRFEIYSYREGKKIEFVKKGIAWEVDIEYRFKNPPNWNKPEFQNTHIKPKRWKLNPWEMEDGLQNEDFIVWMRISAMPKFRKLYATVGRESGENEKSRLDLPKGEYRLDIIDSDFEVKSFKGTKSVVIATKASLGGKNPVLGYGFIAVGIYLVLIGTFFLNVHFETIKITGLELSNDRSL